VDKAGVTSIAVIGMACRLPGNIDSPERLWDALLRGDDLVTEIPPDRWDADEYNDPQPGGGRAHSGDDGRLADRCVRGLDARRLPTAGRRCARRGGAIWLYRQQLQPWRPGGSLTRGVHGPAQTVDTACSSGLTAVHLACHSLIDGESDLALAGGAAVIRGPAANQDGRTVNIATPSVTAQTAVYRAVAAAGVDASSIGMVEAHGPGTPVGDPHP
jgi:acyl transferase domain-containing protein